LYMVFLNIQLVYNYCLNESVQRVVITIKYKLATKQALFFFDAKKEPKKLLGNPHPKKTPECFKV